MKSSTFRFDAKLTATVDDLQAHSNASSRGDVVRRAIALLKVVHEAQEKGQAVVLRQTSPEGDVVERKIVLP